MVLDLIEGLGLKLQGFRWSRGFSQMVCFFVRSLRISHVFRSQNTKQKLVVTFVCEGSFRNERVCRALMRVESWEMKL